MVWSVDSVLDILELVKGVEEVGRGIIGDDCVWQSGSILLGWIRGDPLGVCKGNELDV